MKEISILGYYTKSGYSFSLSDKLFNLICDTIENEILAKYTFPKIKSTILEILIDVELESDKCRIIQLSKTGRGEYFSFRFFLPYSIVVKNKKLNITAFISEFMECIRTVLSQFNIVPDGLIDRLKEQLIAETSGKKEYEHVKSANEIATEKVLKKFHEMKEAGEI